MPAIVPGTPLHWFVDAFGKAMSHVLSASLGASWSIDINPQEAPETEDTSTPCFGFTVSLGLQGNAAILIKPPDAILLAQKFLGEAVTPGNELTSDYTEAVEELLRQVAGVAVTNLKTSFGDVKLDLVTGDRSTWPGVSISLRASADTIGPMPLELRLNPELLASISSSATTVAPPAAPPQETAIVEQSEPANQDLNLDLLLGVNLSLTLRFGQQTLTLRQILNLNSGSVVELDRQVQEPADLLLGDRLVAHGEVVIVDGNYGLRITDVIDPRQRIDRV